MGDRVQSMIADDQAFTLSRFQSLPWVALASNEQHLAEARGRIVVADSHGAAFMSAVPAEMARYVFDATPLETAYRICPVVTIMDWGGGRLNFVLTVDSEDAVGGNAASDTYTASLRGTQPGRRREAKVLWPFTGADRTSLLISRSLAWVKHDVHPALPTPARVLIVTMGVTSSWGGPVGALYCGCSAVGFRA